MAYPKIHLSLSDFIVLDWTLMIITLIPILIRLSTCTRNNCGRNSLASTIADGFVVFAWLSGCVWISINTWKNNLRMKYLVAPSETLYYGVPRELSETMLHVSWISTFFIYISLWSVKAAFLAYYWDIFSSRGRTMKEGLAAACIFTAAMFVLHMLLIALWCSPISWNWLPPPGGHLCFSMYQMSSVTISTFTTIAIDFVILSIPIGTIIAKKWNRIQQVGLVLVFSMGGLSIFAALMRFVSLKLSQSTPETNITHVFDLWALVEIVSSILAACLVSLKTLIPQDRWDKPKGVEDVGISKSSGVLSMDKNLIRVNSEKRD